jgi:predicted N-acetyltransferase YhbS
MVAPVTCWTGLTWTSFSVPIGRMWPHRSNERNSGPSPAGSKSNHAKDAGLVVTGRGEVVAFCTAWLDEDNSAGLLEPVGSHPSHQQRGLGRSVVIVACHALRAAGARAALVGFSSQPGFATYTSAGFELTTHEVCFFLSSTGSLALMILCSSEFENVQTRVRVRHVHQPSLVDEYVC